MLVPPHFFVSTAFKKMRWKDEFRKWLPKLSKYTKGPAMSKWRCLIFRISKLFRALYYTWYTISKLLKALYLYTRRIESAMHLWSDLPKSSEFYLIHLRYGA